MTERVLKPGWCWVKFGDVVRLSGERRANPLNDGLERYVGLEHLDPDDLRIRRWGDVADGTTFTNYFKPGQVLFGKRRAYQRKVAVADFEGVCSGDIYVFEPRDKRLLPELLPFICQTDAFFDYAIGTSTGSLSPRTNWKSLAQYEFALPPLEEQLALAGSIKAAHKSVEAHRAVDERLKILIRAASKFLFDKVLNGDVAFMPLAGVCRKKSQSGIYKPEEFYGSGTPVVHMNELFGYDCIAPIIEMQKVRLSDGELAKYMLTNDDLLFGRRSIVLEGAGRCVLAEVKDVAVAFESSILRVTLDSRIMNSNFAFEWFRSPHGQRHIQSIRTFTTVAGVRGSDVDRLPVPVISLEKQKELVANLQVLRRSLNSTPKSIMNANYFLRQLVNQTTYGYIT